MFPKEGFAQGGEPGAIGDEAVLGGCEAGAEGGLRDAGDGREDGGARLKGKAREAGEVRFFECGPTEARGNNGQLFHVGETSGRDFFMRRKAMRSAAPVMRKGRTGKRTRTMSCK